MKKKGTLDMGESQGGGAREGYDPKNRKAKESVSLAREEWDFSDIQQCDRKRCMVHEYARLAILNCESLRECGRRIYSSDYSKLFMTRWGAAKAELLRENWKSCGRPELLLDDNGQGIFEHLPFSVSESVTLKEWEGGGMADFEKFAIARYGLCFYRHGDVEGPHFGFYSINFKYPLAEILKRSEKAIRSAYKQKNKGRKNPNAEKRGGWSSVAALKALGAARLLASGLSITEATDCSSIYRNKKEWSTCRRLVRKAAKEIFPQFKCWDEELIF